jgi:alkylation response protein AidB-like acyl-CoA dehydrogenase
MNFDFSDDQKLLQTATRDYLDDNASLSVNRAVLEDASVSMNTSLWEGAAEMGWLGAVIPEEFGGAGFGYLEMVLIAEEIGRSLAPIPFSSSHIAAEAILKYGRRDQHSALLPGFADGSKIGTVALAEGSGVVRADNVKTTYRNGTVSGRKVAVSDGLCATHALVAATSGSGNAMVLVDLAGAGVVRDATESIDPTRQCATLSFDNAKGELIGDEDNGWQQLQDVLDRGAVVQAFEQVGGAARAMEITKAQILERYAFGRQIGSFQAIKHRMADLYAAIEIARSNCFYGAWALANDADDLGLAAATARVSASDAFNLAAQEMIQLHGGVGFTWEYDCHMFYRRAQHLGLMLGAANEWRDKLVDHLAAQAA